MIEAFRMRPFTWFLILLLFNLLLLSIQVRNPDGTILLRAWGLLIFTPVASALHFSTRSVSHLLGGYVLLTHTAQENRNLKAENERLRVEVNRLRGVAAMVPRIQNFQDLLSRYDFDWVEANVVGLGDNGVAPFFIERMSISAGSLNGIFVDAAVFNPKGLVGRVYTVNPLSAEVQLITSEGAATGVLLAESRLQCILLGNGSAILDLDFVPNSEKVQEGELLETSGTDRVYPKGIPVGRVVSSRVGPGIYRSILVEPVVDFQRIEEVLVETGASQTQAPQAGDLEGGAEAATP